MLEGVLAPDPVRHAAAAHEAGDQAQARPQEKKTDRDRGGEDREGEPRVRRLGVHGGTFLTNQK
jgi:hypothetical protein